MNQTETADKDGREQARIPVRFDDGEGAEGEGAGGGELTPREIGEQSIYEGETEVRRRINRGEEGDAPGERERADDSDAAGTIDHSELPESREDRDTTVPHGSDERAAEEAGKGPGESARKADAYGPAVAELVATRSELRRVEGELQRLEAERDDLADRLMRRQADFENYRKRVERERAETYQRALVEVVGRLLPVLDNLRRAVDVELEVEEGESEEFRHFLSGVELIAKQLSGLLESFGVEAVPAVGQPFDPHVHEAVAAEQTEEFAPDTVIEEMQRGYRLGDKLLRPAMVKVAK